MSGTRNVDTLKDGIFLLFISCLLLILMILSVFELVIEEVLRVIYAEVGREFIRVLDVERGDSFFAKKVIHDRAVAS